MRTNAERGEHIADQELEPVKVERLGQGRRPLASDVAPEALHQLILGFLFKHEAMRDLTIQARQHRFVQEREDIFGDVRVIDMMLFEIADQLGRGELGHIYNVRRRK